MNRSILSFIKQVLLFAVLLVPVYCLLVILIADTVPDAYTKNINHRMGAYGHVFSRFQEAASSQNIDVLILGSSHAYRGFDTRIFAEQGIRAFNLGTSAQTPIPDNASAKVATEPQTAVPSSVSASFL